MEAYADSFLDELRHKPRNLGTAVLVDPRGNIVADGIEELERILKTDEPGDEAKSRGADDMEVEF